MIAACQGERVLELPEKGHAIWHFLFFIQRANFCLKGDRWDVDFCDFVVFLHKYDCELALQLLVEGVVGMPVAYAARPLLLFLIGIHAERYPLCARALDLPPQCWGDTPADSRPPKVGDLTVSVLHPLAFSRNLFCRLPQDILWALLHLPYQPADSAHQGGMGDRFLGLINYIV